MIKTFKVSIGYLKNLMLIATLAMLLAMTLALLLHMRNFRGVMKHAPQRIDILFKLEPWSLQPHYFR